MKEIHTSQLRRLGIENLNNVLQTVGKRKEIPNQLDAILVFSGPGNYDKPLSEGDSWMMGWMDRDRVRFGVALYHEYVAQAKAKTEGLKKDVRTLSEEDMRRYGPLFAYNGVDSKGENEAVLAAFEAFSALPDTFTDRNDATQNFRKIPLEKLVVLRTVQKNGQRVEISHTGHQVESLLQELEDPNNPLYGAQNIAVVSHAPHFPRIQFSLQRIHETRLGKGVINIYPFAPRPRIRLNVPTYIRNEARKWIEYGRKGDLSQTPYPMSFPKVLGRRVG